MAVLIDTNIFLALAFPRDPNHGRVQTVMRELSGGRVIVAPLLPELFYLMSERIGYRQARQSFDLLRSSAFQIEALTADLARMSQIMQQYEDSAFDFVDTAIMAVSERLNITDVYTLDRRDFPIFRPQHCLALTLLP